MRKGKIVPYLLTVLFLAAVAVIGMIDLEWKPFPFTVEITADGNTEQIGCWKDRNGDYYVFLPGYAERSQTRFHVNLFHKVFVGGRELKEGMPCDGFQLNVPYDLTYADGGTEYRYTVTFIQSAEVATMYLDVSSGSMDYIHAEKGNEEPGTIRLYTADGALNHTGDVESLNGRGNATWADDKKPYSLTLSGEADLLGMGQAQEWILLANAYDGSHMKNKIAYDLANALGLAYSPDCQWVDLYLNGEYAGLYLLTERNEVHPQRVAISRDTSFLVAMEPQYRLVDQGYPFVTTQSGVALRIHHAAMSTDALAQMWQSAENAILAEDGIDPDTGKSWQEWIDVDSWVKKYLISEVLGDPDAISASQYFYYDETDPSGKIYAGPIWDMDASMAEGDWAGIDYRILHVYRPHQYRITDTPWLYALYEKEPFYNRTVEIYQTELRPLLQDLLDSRLEQYTAQTAQAAAGNAIRWNISEPAESIKKIRTYLQTSMAFFDELWLEDTPYYMVQVDADDGPWVCYAVRQGSYLPALPEFENTEATVYHGWYTVDTDEPFDITQPIYEDAAIYRKQENANVK